MLIVNTALVYSKQDWWCVFVCLFVCTVYVCMCVCVCACIYVCVWCVCAGAINMFLFNYHDDAPDNPYTYHISSALVGSHHRFFHLTVCL